MPKEPTLQMSRLGRCRRQVGYQALRIPQSDPPTPEDQANLQRGNVQEPRVIEDLARRGFQVRDTGKDQRRVELVSSGGIIMRGRPDGLILEEDSWKILEVKSVGPKPFKQWRALGVAAFRPHYVATANGYMAATGIWQTRFEAATGEDLRIYTEYLSFNLPLWTSLVERWEQVWPTIRSGELPAPDYDGSDFHCSQRFCPWSSLCPSGLAYQEQEKIDVHVRRD